MASDFDKLSKYRQIVDEIKSHDLAEYISRDIKLDQIGKLLRCSSPFRSDSDPSFFVYPDNLWHDFGTKESGDIIKYVCLRNKCDFKEAISILSKDYGIAPIWKPEASTQEKDEIDEEIRRMTERFAVFDILTAAINYWHEHMPSKIKDDILIKHYGLSEDIIIRLKIGFAHGDLAAHLLGKGYRKDMLLKSSLFIDSGDGQLISIYKERIIFPYWFQGQVVYLIARKTEYTDTTVPWEKAKYKKLTVFTEKHNKISPYIKNDWFYNEDVCSRKSPYVVITEGVTDCISCIQIDEPCISPVTTRFKLSDIPKLVLLFKRMAVKTIYMCNDADVLLDGSKPGEEGALDTAEALTREGFDVKICDLIRPEGVSKIDLNEQVKIWGEGAKAAFAELRSKAKFFLDFIVDKIPLDTPKEELDKKLEPWFKALSNVKASITRDALIETVKKRFKLRKSAIVESIDRFTGPIEKPKKEIKEETKQKKQKESERFKGVVYQDESNYFTLNNGSVEVISNFTITLKKRILIDGILYNVGDIYTETNEIIKDFVFKSSSWKSRKDFISALNDPRLVWTGGDDQVQGVLKLLTQFTVPTQNATQVLGYNDSDGIQKWIWSDGTIYSDRFLSKEESEMQFLPNGSRVEKRYKYINTPLEEVKSLASTVFNLLTKINKPEVTLPILGWFYATPYKPRINKILGHFPILMVWGTKESGKTSMLQHIFWRLMGVSEQTEPYSCTDTAFAITKKLESTNSCPLLFDEHKPRDMGKIKTEQLHRFMRRAYGGETEERGGKDLQLQSAVLAAPWAIAGESPPSDPATLDRLLQVRPSPVTLLKNPEMRDAFNALRELPLERLATNYIQFTLGNGDVLSLIKEAKEMTNTFILQGKKDRVFNERLRGTVPTRLHDNISCMVFGLFRFQKWAEYLGIEIPEIDIVSAVRALIMEAIEIESPAGKDSFDSFLEAIHPLIIDDIIKENETYSWSIQKDHGETFSFHLESIYMKYLSERKKAGLDDETGGLRALLSVAKEKIEQDSYIIRMDHRVNMKNGNLRCIQINPMKIPSSLSFYPPPKARLRTHGGGGEDKQ